MKTGKLSVLTEDLQRLANNGIGEKSRKFEQFKVETVETSDNVTSQLQV
jgi:hypothetical protein